MIKLLKEMIIATIITIGIGFGVVFLWQSLEIEFLGGITYDNVDTIFACILSISLYYNLEHKLDSFKCQDINNQNKESE